MSLLPEFLVPESSEPTLPRPQDDLMIARMYRHYLVEDLAARRGVQRTHTDDALFQTSIAFAQAVDIHKKLDPTELAETPEFQYILGTIVDLPAGTNKERHDRDTLLQAANVVTNHSELVPQSSTQVPYETAVKRAASIHSLLRNLNRPSELQRKLRASLGGACVQALLIRNGVALATLPHQRMHNPRNPHDGVLLYSPEHHFTSPVSYIVNNGCLGFAEGHPTDDRDALLKKVIPRIRVLSACCDLRVDYDNGRQDIPGILELLQEDANTEGDVLPSDQTTLDTLTHNLVETILFDTTRKGMKPKPVHYPPRTVAAPQVAEPEVVG